MGSEFLGASALGWSLIWFNLEPALYACLPLTATWRTQQGKQGGPSNTLGVAPLLPPLNFAWRCNHAMPEIICHARNARCNHAGGCPATPTGIATCLNAACKINIIMKTSNHVMLCPASSIENCSASAIGWQKNMPLDVLGVRLQYWSSPGQTLSFPTVQINNIRHQSHTSPHAHTPSRDHGVVVHKAKHYGKVPRFTTGHKTVY